jgi:hypothetical protein
MGEEKLRGQRMRDEAVFPSGLHCPGRAGRQCRRGSLAEQIRDFQDGAGSMFVGLILHRNPSRVG